MCKNKNIPWGKRFNRLLKLAPQSNQFERSSNRQVLRSISPNLQDILNFVGQWFENLLYMCEGMKSAVGPFKASTRALRTGSDFLKRF